MTDFFSWNLKVLYAKVLTDVTLAGIQLFMWVYMMAHFRNPPKESKNARIFYLAISFSLFWLTGTAAIVNALGVYELLLKSSPMNWDSGWMVYDRVLTGFLNDGSIIFASSLLVADSVMIYRCYIVWHDKRWVIFGPLFLFIVNTGLVVHAMFRLITNSHYNTAIDVTNLFVSAFFHIVVTALVCGRLVHAHCRVKKALSSPQTVNPFLSTVSILIESVAPLPIFGVATAVCVALPSSLNTVKAAIVLQFLYKIFATLSLQLIIFRVAAGWSWADVPESKAFLSQDIMFIDTNTESYV